MSEVEAKQPILDLDKAAALLQQAESVEQTAKASFTNLLRRLSKKSELLSQLAVQKKVRPFNHEFVIEGIFLNFPKTENLYLNVNADVLEMSTKVHPDVLISRFGAVKCIDALVCAIRERIDAITAQHEEAQRAIAMADAMVPD